MYEYSTSKCPSCKNRLMNRGLRPVHSTQGALTSRIKNDVQIGAILHSNDLFVESAAQVNQSIDAIPSGVSNSNENDSVLGIQSLIQSTSIAKTQEDGEIGAVSHSNDSSVEGAVQVNQSIDVIQSGTSNSNENDPVLCIQSTLIAKTQKEGEIDAVLHSNDSLSEGDVRMNRPGISNIDENVDVFPMVEENQPNKRRVRFVSVDFIRSEVPNAAISARRTRRAMSLDTGRVHLYEANPCGNLPAVQTRRSTRKRIPIERFNYGMVKCCVCKKTFHQPMPIAFYVNDLVCSFQCIQKHN